MSLSIRLCTKNVKLRLIAWACLAFAVKHPSASVRIPVKTVQAIYGTAFSAATAKSLRALRWNDGDGAEHPTFAAVESAPGKTQTWWVSFNVQLVDTARHLSPEAIILNIYSGLPDISRWIFQMTVDELDGRLPPLDYRRSSNDPLSNHTNQADTGRQCRPREAQILSALCEPRYFNHLLRFAGSDARLPQEKPTRTFHGVRRR